MSLAEQKRVAELAERVAVLEARLAALEAKGRRPADPAKPAKGEG